MLPPVTSSILQQGHVHPWRELSNNPVRIQPILAASYSRHSGGSSAGSVALGANQGERAAADRCICLCSRAGTAAAPLPPGHPATTHAPRTMWQGCSQGGWAPLPAAPPGMQSGHCRHVCWVCREEVGCGLGLSWCLTSPDCATPPPSPLSTPPACLPLPPPSCSSGPYLLSNPSLPK